MKSEIYVILNNIRSLHNVGSIFRTADGAGVKKVFLCGYTGRPPRKEIQKTALGAETYVPWEHFEKVEDCIDQLKQQDVQIVVMEPVRGAIPYHQFKPKGPVCLVLGNEVDGLPPILLKQADAILAIPMHGQKESLNVSVAFGIVVYALSEAFFS